MKGFPDVWVNPTLLLLKPAERLAGREVRDLSGVAGSYNLIVRINVGQVNTENVFVLQLYICLGWYFYFCSCSVRVRKTRVSVRGDRPTSPEKTPGFVSLRRLEVSPDVLQKHPLLWLDLVDVSVLCWNIKSWRPSWCFTRRFTGKEKMSWMDLQLFVQTFKLWLIFYRQATFCEHVNNDFFLLNNTFVEKSSRSVPSPLRSLWTRVVEPFESEQLISWLEITAEMKVVLLLWKVSITGCIF